MSKKQTISLMHACFFIPASSYGGIIFLHSAILLISQRQAWIAELLGGLLLIPLGLWILNIMGRHPQKTIFEIIEITSGKFIARSFCILYICILIVLSALILRQFSAMIQMYFLHTTPIIFVMLMVLLVSSTIASDGIESLGRVNLILVFVAYPVFYMVLGFGLIRKFEWANIMPIFEKSLQSFLNGTYLSAGLLSEGLLFMMIMAASINKPSKSYKGIFYSMLVFVGCVPASVVLFTNGVLGPEEASHIAFAGINVAQAISVGRIIQGLEVFIITTYQVIVIVKLAINFFALGDTLVYTIGWKYNSKFMLAFIAPIVLLLSLYLGSSNEASNYYVHMGRYVLIPFIFLVLLVASSGILLKNGRGKRK